MIWLSATNQTWQGDFMEQAAIFQIYGRDDRGEVPSFGDCWSLGANESAYHLISVSSAISKNGFAEQYYLTELDEAWDPFKAFRVMYRDHSVSGLALESLPLAKAFPDAGFLAARNHWGDDQTLMVFKSTPFYSFGHHHRDENSFIVNRKGPLLIDSGIYDYWGSTHYHKYYSRTVAHNSLLVYWEDEPVRSGFTNDGGQKSPVSSNDDPATLADVMGPHRLDGIAGYACEDSFAWVRGDASDAYAVEKLSDFTRDVVYLYELEGFGDPVILVVDHVGLPVSNTPRILWHVSREPTLNAGYALIDNDGGAHARLDFLAPANANVVSIGGSGREWEVNGVNYPPDSNNMDEGVPGWGRIAVSPASEVVEECFVALIALGDSEVNGDALGLATPFSGPGWQGAMVKDTVIIVSQDGGLQWIDLDSPEVEQDDKILIVGLGPSVETHVAVGDDVYVMNANGNGTIYQTLEENLLQPGFVLSCAESALAMESGESIQVELSLTTINGFDSTVTLNATGLPDNVTASFDPNNATSTTSVLLEIEASVLAKTSESSVIVHASGENKHKQICVDLQINHAGIVGDINDDEAVDLDDVVSILKILTNDSPLSFTPAIGKSLDGMKLHLNDSIYDLRLLSGLVPPMKPE